MDNNSGDRNRIRRKKVSSRKSTPGQQNRTEINRKKRSSEETGRKPRPKTVRKSGSGRPARPQRPSASQSRNGSNSAPKRSTPRSRKTTKRKRKFKIRNLLTFKAFGKFLILAVLIGSAVVGGTVFAALRDVKPVNEALLDKKTYQTTTIRYANGDKMTTAPNSQKKTPVPLSDMSPYLRKAIVSIEDERFYDHKGVDITGLARSVINTALGKKQGGSTIPMQVSKMLLTSSNQTITRKIKDLYYASEMSKTVSKDKILETYLNNFFVGRGLVGAEAGSRGYFDKHAKDLTLGEAAMLAGITKNPTKYSVYITERLTGDETKKQLEHKIVYFARGKDSEIAPSNSTEMNMIDKMNDWGFFKPEVYKQLKDGNLVIRKAANNPEAKNRQVVVLKKMLELKKINEKEYAEAVAQPIDIKIPEDEEDVSSSVESLIENDVVQALKEQGYTEEEARQKFYSGGLIINSTIDPKIQDSLDKVYDNKENFPNNKMGPNGIIQPQSASVVLDFKTGAIKGIVGGRNILGKKTLNRALIPHQPGSTIKPLSVYTPAIDTMKLTQSTVFSDARGGYRFPETRKWNPNTTTSGKGSMSMRKALSLSSNTIAGKTAELLGDTYYDCCDVMIDYLRNFGITTLDTNKNANRRGTDRDFGPLVLGGLSKGISPLQMAAAYGTLANGGVYVEPEIFTTITSFDGQLIVKNTPETHKVVDPAVAYVVSDMLKSVVTEGIGKRAALPGGMPVYGKTGSSNDYKDTWFVGFTPYYVAATYVADDQGVRDKDGNVIKRRSFEGGGGVVATVVWQKVMAKIHQNLPAKDLNKPANVYFTRINPADGGRASYGSNAAFIEGTGPERASYIPAPVQPKPQQQTPHAQQGAAGGQQAQQGTAGGQQTQQGAAAGQQQQGAVQQQTQQRAPVQQAPVQRQGNGQ